MKKYLLILLTFISLRSFSQEVKKISDIKDADQNVLVIINGLLAGTMKELRTDLLNFPAENIQRIDILKGESAIKKYGEKGKAGVIELVLKNAELVGAKGIIEETQVPYAVDSVFVKVEIEASFPGGEKAWRTYLEKNLNVQIASDNYAPPGTYTVFVQFIVDKTGTISDVKPLTNHGFGMEQEVVKVITKGPNWAPAIVNGRQVKAYRKQPVTFQIVGEFELSTYKIAAGKSTEIGLKTDAGEKPEDLDVTLSNGTITHKEGNTYTILVDKPGKVLLSVKKKAKKRKDEYDYGTVEIKVE